MEDINELKAAAYDLIALSQETAARLRAVNERIAELMSAPAPDPVSESDDAGA